MSVQFQWTMQLNMPPWKKSPDVVTAASFFAHISSTECERGFSYRIVNDTAV